MSYRTFEAYKDSGIDWLGDIPRNWQHSRVKYVSKIETGDGDTQDAEVEAEYPFFVRSPIIERIGRYSHDTEAVLTAGDGAGVGKIFHRFRGKFSAHQRVYIVSKFMDVDPGYFYFYFSTIFGLVALDGSAKSTVESVRRPMIADLAITLPPLVEQKQIADFLDRETEQIDNLIAEQQGLVENLTERRKAVISHAVTKGLNPNVDLKASGSEWASRIPKHWSVKKFSRVIDINGGQVDPTAEPFADMLMIAPNHIEKFTGRLLLRETAAEQGAESGKYIATAGQVIYSKIRPNLCKATIAPTDCLCSADMYSMSGRSGAISNQFLLYFMLSKSFTDFATDSSMRVAMPKINRESLAPFRIWLPPVKEQHEIVAYLDEQARLVDALITEAKSLIDLLKERRSALISAAVTGKIDVRSEVLSRG